MAAARRRRESFASDIGDERARAFAHQEPRAPGRWSGILLIGLLVFSCFAAIALLRGSPGGLVRVQCNQPDIGTSAGVAQPNGQAAWQAAGPESGEYAVALDAGAVTADGSGLRADTGRVLAGPFRLTGCASAQTVFDAPTRRGRHQITLFHRTGSGPYAPVAGASLRVG